MPHRYKAIRMSKHHFVQSNGKIYEHRYVWEQFNKAVLLPWGIVHHVNNISRDNRPENLEGMTNRRHKVFHPSHRKPKSIGILGLEAEKTWNEITNIILNLMS